MAHKATNPCEDALHDCLDRLFPEKEYVEELDILSEGRHADTLVFTGKYRLTSCDLYVGNKLMVPSLSFYGNCVNAISDSNKRMLAEKEILTDYTTPNPVLARVLGFSEDEARLMVFLQSYLPMPIKMMVQGYDEKTGAKLDTIKIIPQLFSDSDEELFPINNEEAIKIIAEHFMDSGIAVSISNLMEEFGTLAEAKASTSLSDKAREFGDELDCDDPWETLEFSLAYELAEHYFRSMCDIARTAYEHLDAKYSKVQFILAYTTFSFGIDDDNVLHLTDEVATTNNSFIVNQADFEESGKFVQAHLEPLLDYLANSGDENDIPYSLLDELSDGMLYLAENLCEDLEFDVYIN